MYAAIHIEIIFTTILLGIWARSMMNCLGSRFCNALYIFAYLLAVIYMVSFCFTMVGLPILRSTIFGFYYIHPVRLVPVSYIMMVGGFAMFLITILSFIRVWRTYVPNIMSKQVVSVKIIV
jgi:hypothetical protein